MCVQVRVKVRSVGHPRVGVACICDPSDMDAGNLIWVLRKSSQMFLNIGSSLFPVCIHFID